jgi:tetratricopeptide (TPR) repeat protein
MNKYLIITAAVVLAACIYFAPRKSSTESSKPAMAAEHNHAHDFDTEEFLSTAKKSLPFEALTRLQNFDKEISTGNNLAAYDSAAAIFDKAKRPEVAAIYFEKKAEKEKTETNYLNAAYRYFDGFKMAKDSLTLSHFVARSIDNYQKVLEINPNNLNAKTDLGICYTEGTAEPMKGIMLLREVITANPKHENAQLNLGFLSVKSGQYDKAQERFDKVLEINPARLDVYIFKAQTYFQSGNKEKAIQYFEKFKEYSNDNELIAEVDNFIKEIKAGK